MADKAGLEEALMQKEAQEERLVEELEDLRRKAHQAEEGLCAELENLRAKHQELSEEHAALLRQKEHLSAGLGEREKGEWSDGSENVLFTERALPCAYVTGLLRCVFSPPGYWLNLDPAACL